MYLARVEENKSGKRISLEQSRESNDFVSAAVVLELDSQEQIHRMQFNSSSLGIAELDHAEGLIMCNTWESEDAARNSGDTARHFPIIAMNGRANGAYAKEIMRDVLHSLDDQYLIELAEKFADKDAPRLIFNLNKLKPGLQP